MGLLYAVAFAAICSLVVGKIIEIHPCTESQVNICQVTEARVDPCTAYPCYLKRKHNASISFDFTPHFTATNLSTLVYYPNGVSDVAFDQFGSTEACKFTKCPTEPGVSQTMDYTLYIGKRLPSGTHTFKWKIWNVDNIAESCCFMTAVLLKRK